MRILDDPQLQRESLQRPLVPPRRVGSASVDPSGKNTPSRFPINDICSATTPRIALPIFATLVAASSNGSIPAAWASWAIAGYSGELACCGEHW